MLPFDALFPEMNPRECRSITLLKDTGVMKQGSYAFRESYCTDRGCDCRRVLVSVYHMERMEHLATISHSFELPEPDSGFEQTFLDPMNIQTPQSGPLLQIFCNVVSGDPEYRARLVRHYTIWKEVVDDPGHPEHLKLLTILANANGTRPPKGIPARRTTPKIGQNDPCPCGSGKKYKKCCRP